MSGNEYESGCSREGEEREGGCYSHHNPFDDDDETTTTTTTATTATTTSDVTSSVGDGNMPTRPTSTPPLPPSVLGTHNPFEEEEKEEEEKVV